MRFLVINILLVFLVSCTSSSPDVNNNDNDSISFNFSDTPDNDLGTDGIDGTDGQSSDDVSGRISSSDGTDGQQGTDGNTSGDGVDGTQSTGNSLVINEIMYDPKAVSDDNGEWLELFNPSSKSIDIRGWTLRDKGDNEHIISEPAIIEAGQYFVLARNNDVTKNGGVEVDYVYSDFFLANGAGDSVVILDKEGLEVDSLSYKTDSPWPLKQPGFSIELNATDLDNSNGENWSLAKQGYGDGDKGTPGQPNGAPEPSFTVDESIADWQSPELKATLRFAPHDGLESHVLSELASAKEQIRMAFFNIRLPAVRSILEELNASGVDISIILDKKTQDLEYNTMAEQLLESGLNVILSENEKAEKSTMHNKFTVIDGHRVLTGSANYSSTALNKSDEDLMTIDSEDIAARYLIEFDEIAANEYAKSAPYPADAKLRAWMGPEDDLDGKVQNIIDKSESLLVIAQFQFNVKQLYDAVIKAQERGVNIICILDAKQSNEETLDESLVSAGIHVIYAENTSGKYSEMHSKFVVADHKILAMGSYNWTSLASFHNDENIVVVEEANLVARAEGKIADMINLYSSLEPKSLGLETGPRNVTFELTNITPDDGAVVKIETVNGPYDDGLVLNDLKVSVEIEAGMRLNYRYLVEGPTGIVKESGPLHWFTVPYAPGPFIIKDVFRP